jgi:hypothetical protein
MGNLQAGEIDTLEQKVRAVFRAAAVFSLS